MNIVINKQHLKTRRRKTRKKVTKCVGGKIIAIQSVQHVFFSAHAVEAFTQFKNSIFMHSNSTMNFMFCKQYQIGEVVCYIQVEKYECEQI